MFRRLNIAKKAMYIVCLYLFTGVLNAQIRLPKVNIPKVEVPNTTKKEEPKATTNSNSSNNNTRSTGNNNSTSNSNSVGTRDSKNKPVETQKVSSADNLQEYLQTKMIAYRNLYESQNTILHSSRSKSNPIPVNGKTYQALAADFQKDSVLIALEKYFAGGNKNAMFVNFKNDLLDYPNYITFSGILDHANKLAGTSYEMMKAKNTAQAIEYAENAQGYCKGVLSMQPNTQKAKDVLTFANKAYDNATAGMAKAYTSDFHKTHVNKIVFSTIKFAVGSETASQTQNTFTAGQTIYGTAYFSDKIVNLMSNSNENLLFINLTLDGQTLQYYNPHVLLTAENKQKTYIQFALVPKESDDLITDVKAKSTMIKEFNQTISTKGPMIYNIGVEFSFSKTDESINGQFSYDLSGGTEYNDKLVKKIEDIELETARMPKSAQSDPVLEAKILKKLNNLNNGSTFSNCRITSASWTVIKHEITGIPLHKYIYVMVLEKKSDGNCYMHQYKVKYEYTGNGTYATEPALIDAENDDRIKCSNGNL